MGPCLGLVQDGVGLGLVCYMEGLGLGLVY